MTSTDLPRMQNQARSRAPVERGRVAVAEPAEKVAPKAKAPMMRQYELVERVRQRAEWTILAEFVGPPGEHGEFLFAGDGYGLGQQLGFADPGLAFDHDEPAPAGPGVPQHAAEQRELALSAEQRSCLAHNPPRDVDRLASVAEISKATDV